MSTLKGAYNFGWLPDFCKICAHLMLIDVGAGVVVVVVVIIEVGLLMAVNERCWWWWRRRRC